MEPEEAHALAVRLLDDLGIEQKRAPYPELRDLLVKLDHHPLAIQLVLQAMQDKGLTLAAIGEDLAPLLDKFVDDTVTGRNRSLMASLEYSLRRLSEEQRGLVVRLAPFEGGAHESCCSTSPRARPRGAGASRGRRARPRRRPSPGGRAAGGSAKRPRGAPRARRARARAAPRCRRCAHPGLVDAGAPRLLRLLERLLVGGDLAAERLDLRRRPVEPRLLLAELEPLRLIVDLGEDLRLRSAG